MPERLQRDVRAFHELARVVALEPFDVVGIMERVCAELRHAFGFTRTMFLRLNQADGAVRAVVQLDVTCREGEWLPLERLPFLERARLTRQVSFVAGVREERAMPAEVRQLFEVRSLVAVPLYIDESCLGFIVGDRAGTTLDLDERDVELLTGLGQLAAVFVAKADQFASLAASVDELRRVDAAKSEFLSLATHELRTPIAVVHGIVSTLHLRGHQLSDEQLAGLRATLYEQTLRLTVLTDQLLDLSRLEARAVRIRPERFRPRERVDSLLPRLVPDQLDDIEVTIDPDLVLNVDPDGIERVLSNLVVNGLRYGLPPVRILSQVSEGVRLVVEDRGPGVAPEFVPLMFERFTRSDADRGKGIVGAGLGLSIARSYAYALGGELSYEHAVPHGARFTLALPQAALA